jgi:hypothetical protein
VVVLANRTLRIAYGVAEVVGRNGFEDHARRVRFIFSGVCREFVEALSALEELEVSEAVQSPPLLDGEF